jgi:WD40 repeat protein
MRDPASALALPFSLLLLALAPDGARAGGEAPVRFEITHTRAATAGPRTSPDGRLAVRLEGDLAARVVDARSGRPASPALRHGLRREGMRINAWAFSPDGKLLATASSHTADEDSVGEVRVWEAATGKLLATATDARHDLGWVWTLRFTPDSRTVLVGCDPISGK